MPSAITGLDDPFGTSTTIGGTNMTSLPTGGSTYGGTNIATGSLPNIPVDQTQTLPATDPTASGAPTASGDTSWLDSIGNWFNNNAGNIANIGSTAYLSKQQQDANSKLAGQLKDQAAPILASGQNQLANYQNLTDLQKKAMETGVNTGTALSKDADPLLGIGRTAFDQYTGGQLPAWQQAELDRKVAQQKALARQSLGANVDSSTLSQVDAQIDQQAMIAKGQALSQNLASGESAYKQGTDLTSQGGATTKAAYDKASADITTNLHNALDTITAGLGPLSDSIKYEIAGNTALQKSMQDLYGAISKAGTTTGGGSGSTNPISSVVGGIKSIYDKVTGGSTPAVTPPGIPAMVGGIPSPAPLPAPVLPPTGGPAASVGPEPFDANTPLYGPENGATPTDPTGTQPTDPTGTQPTDPTGTTPQAANTGASGVSSGAQLAEAVGATGAAAEVLSALSGAAVRHGALLITDLAGNPLVPLLEAANTAEGATAITATSEALAAAGAIPAETSEIAAIASNSVAAGMPLSVALSTAASVVLPVAIVAFALNDMLKKVDPVADYRSNLQKDSGLPKDQIEAMVSAYKNALDTKLQPNTGKPAYKTSSEIGLDDPLVGEVIP